MEKENDFVQYPLAFRMKKLGYNDMCYRAVSGSTIYDCGGQKITRNSDYVDSKICAQPLYTQAFRWFREKHHLVGLPTVGNQEYSYRIFDEKEGRSGKMLTEGIRQIGAHFNGSYEEAECACLEMLIQIVEEKQL